MSYNPADLHKLSRTERLNRWLHQAKTKERGRSVGEGLVIGGILSVVAIIFAPILGIGVLAAGIAGKIGGTIIAARRHKHRKKLALGSPS